MAVVVVSLTWGLGADILPLARCTPCQTMPYIEPAYEETPKLTIYGESVAAQTSAAECKVQSKTVAEEFSCGGKGGGETGLLLEPECSGEPWKMEGARRKSEWVGRSVFSSQSGLSPRQFRKI